MWFISRRDCAIGATEITRGIVGGGWGLALTAETRRTRRPGAEKTGTQMRAG